MEIKLMELLSIRKWYTDKSTISELFINQITERICYMLEPTIRVGKDPRGIVAISEGRYEITLYDSPHFQMKVPLLMNVPGHNYVEIHPGNFPIDTHDCLLPGLTSGQDIVNDSRAAFNILFPKIDQELNTKQVFITIKNSGA
jgi:hypothetical protein